MPKPEYWALLDNPKTIGTLALEHGEPFTPPMLDAMERTLLNPTTDGVQLFAQFRAAEFLYRYRRLAGRNFLIKRFQEGQSPEVAEIFALNQEREMLPGVLQSLDKQSIDVTTLKDWNTPEINDALVAAFQRDPENPQYGTILSAHNDQRAIPLLWHIYNTAPSPNSGDTDGIRKLDAAAALVRLHVPESNQLINFLLHQLALPRSQLPFMLWRMYVITALGQTGDIRAEIALKQVISHYLANGVSAKEYALTMSSQDLSPDELAIYAAAALAEAKAISARSLVAKLLLHAKADSTAASKGRANYNNIEYLDSWDSVAHSLLGVKRLTNRSPTSHGARMASTSTIQTNPSAVARFHFASRSF